MILAPSQLPTTVRHHRSEFTARENVAIRREKNNLRAEKNMDDTLKMILEPKSAIIKKNKPIKNYGITQEGGLSADSRKAKT
jgi:hypothetical protein